MRRSMIVLAASLAAVSVAACGSSALTEPVPVPAAATTETAATPSVMPSVEPTLRESTPTPAASTDAPARPPRAPAAPGPTFGFVHAVDASMFPTVVLLDDAEWFAGDDAVAAARADGHDVGEEGLENGYYIRNERQDTSELTAVGNVVITIVEPDGTERTITPQEWEERIRSQASGEGAFYEPYHLTVVDGEIVEVRSQPIPLS